MYFKSIKNKGNDDSLLLMGLISFLILSSVGFITTTMESRLFIEPLRYMAILITSAVLFIVIFHRRGGFVVLVVIYALLFAWGLALSWVNGALSIGMVNVWMNFLVPLSGALLLVNMKAGFRSHLLAMYFIFYVLVSLLATYLFGGLELSYPPRFIFDAVSHSGGSVITYSQGASKLFGLAAITMAFLFVREKLLHIKIIFLLMLLLFSGLSVLGGARGDVFFAFLIIIGYLSIVYKMKGSGAMVVLGMALTLLPIDWSFLTDFIFFSRITYLGDGSWGERDVLFMKSLDLLKNNPECLVIGCGFGYFQMYYSFPYGVYPHNIIIEFLIVFGLPLLIAASIVVWKGASKHMKIHDGVDLVLLFFLYDLFVGLKSGTLFGQWIFIATALYFSILFFRSEPRKGMRKYKRRQVS